MKGPSCERECSSWRRRQRRTEGNLRHIFPQRETTRAWLQVFTCNLIRRQNFCFIRVSHKKCASCRVCLQARRVRTPRDSSGTPSCRRCGRRRRDVTPSSAPSRPCSIASCSPRTPRRDVTRAASRTRATATRAASPRARNVSHAQRQHAQRPLHARAPNTAAGVREGTRTTSVRERFCEQRKRVYFVTTMDVQFVRIHNVQYTTNK